MKNKILLAVSLFIAMLGTATFGVVPALAANKATTAIGDLYMADQKDVDPNVYVGETKTFIAKTNYSMLITAMLEGAGVKLPSTVTPGTRLNGNKFYSTVKNTDTMIQMKWDPIDPKADLDYVPYTPPFTVTFSQPGDVAVVLDLVGRDGKSVTIKRTVHVFPLPTIDFKVDQKFPVLGGKAHLTWDTTEHKDFVTKLNGEVVKAKGAKDVQINQEETYTLVVTTPVPGPSKEQSLTIGYRPQIVSLEIVTEHTPPMKGDKAHISYTTKGATGVTFAGKKYPPNGVIPVEVNGPINEQLVAFNQYEGMNESRPVQIVPNTPAKSPRQKPDLDVLVSGSGSFAPSIAPGTAGGDPNSFAAGTLLLRYNFFKDLFDQKGSIFAEAGGVYNYSPDSENGNPLFTGKNLGGGMVGVGQSYADGGFAELVSFDVAALGDIDNVKPLGAAVMLHGKVALTVHQYFTLLMAGDVATDFYRVGGTGKLGVTFLPADIRKHVDVRLFGGTVGWTCWDQTAYELHAFGEIELAGSFGGNPDMITLGVSVDDIGNVRGNVRFFFPVSFAPEKDQEKYTPNEAYTRAH